MTIGPVGKNWYLVQKVDSYINCQNDNQDDNYDDGQ